MAKDEKDPAKRCVVGWLLDRDQRSSLLNMFSAAYPEVIADHVTLSSSAEVEPPPNDTDADIVGLVDDGAGVQALIVRIDGTTDRPDGSTYHITWSVDRARGRKAVESNDVIRELGWQPVAQPIPITLNGAILPGEP